MPQKQGGKGKTSSPSDQAYWKRVNPAAQKAKRIARHRRRMGLNQAQISAATAPAHYPHVPISREKESVILSLPVRANYAGLYLHTLTVAGVLVEISPAVSDISRAKADTFSRLSYEHRTLNPISGESRCLEYRRES